MPNLDTPGLAYNYEAPAPEIKTLNNQPTIRLDYQPITPLRAIFRYAAESQRKQVFPGSIPGFNDVQTQNPIIATYAATVNYTISASTFLEATYGRIQNELAGCTTLNGVCAAAVPMGQPSNKNNVGLGGLPLIFPDGLGMDPRYYEYKTLNGMNPPFWQNGQILLPPTFAWGNRIGNAPPNISYPALAEPQPDPRLLAQPDEGLGPAHVEDRLLQPPQPQGPEPRHGWPELRRARAR